MPVLIGYYKNNVSCMPVSILYFFFHKIKCHGCQYQYFIIKRGSHECQFIKAKVSWMPVSILYDKREWDMNSSMDTLFSPSPNTGYQKLSSQTIHSTCVFGVKVIIKTDLRSGREKRSVINLNLFWGSLG